MKKEVKFNQIVIRRLWTGKGEGREDMSEICCVDSIRDSIDIVAMCFLEERDRGDEITRKEFSSITMLKDKTMRRQNSRITSGRRCSRGV